MGDPDASGRSFARSARRAWRAAAAERPFRVEASLSVLGLAALLVAFARFLAWVELREGVALPDPVLARFEPRELALPIFALVYGGILLGLALLGRHPRRFVSALQAYALLLLLRGACMVVTPLASPPGLIPLVDPIVNTLVPAAEPLQRDLFFSGHTSVLSLLAFAVPGRRGRIALALAAVAVGALLILQHAHYTVDVLVAPMAAWTAYGLCFLARRREGGMRSERTTRL